MHRRFPILVLPLVAAACQSAGKGSAPAEPCPISGGVSVDHLIREGEDHFEHLWQLTTDGENAEAYWNPASDRLVFQRRWDGFDCDRIFVTTKDGKIENQISDGRGTTTCAYFMPNGEDVIYGSTGAVHKDCPPKPDMSLGYAWAIYPEFDIYIQNLESGETRPLITSPGYDTEATVSPTGDRIVFTSTRSGDIELWTSDLSGGDLVQVTDAVGYDGGAFFSHDGEWLVFRTTSFDKENLVEEHERFSRLLSNNVIRPHSMEIMVVKADGSERRQVTNLGKANWAPYFFPNDERILFCSNHHSTDATGLMNFDLFAIDFDGTNLERITFDVDFDSFAMFSPDGQYLAFSSNRGGAKKGDTNMFIAKWR
ncbi:MAG: TolB protein [Planctomycetota bacterium]|jgi:TolB protein